MGYTFHLMGFALVLLLQDQRNAHVLIYTVSDLSGGWGHTVFDAACLHVGLFIVVVLFVIVKQILVTGGHGLGGPLPRAGRRRRGRGGCCCSCTLLDGGRS